MISLILMLVSVTIATVQAVEGVHTTKYPGLV